MDDSSFHKEALYKCQITIAMMWSDDPTDYGWEEGDGVSEERYLHPDDGDGAGGGHHSDLSKKEDKGADAVDGSNAKDVARYNAKRLQTQQRRLSCQCQSMSPLPPSLYLLLSLMYVSSTSSLYVGLSLSISLSVSLPISGPIYLSLTLFLSLPQSVRYRERNGYLHGSCTEILSIDCYRKNNKFKLVKSK